MIKNLFFALALFGSFTSFGQVVINEIDTDTPGTDDKEFIELKSDVANFSLNGYVLVLYNGSPTSSTGNKSYFTLDLDGFVTDVNGLIVIGNDLVSPVPDRFLQVSTMQNGQDGIALYLGNAVDFPDQTPVTNANLIDAIVYGNNNPDATTLISVLNVQGQINEAFNGNGTTQSIQRKNDGTYEVKAPTPKANNDGTGVTFNGVTISVPANTYNEGQNFNITFTTQIPVASTLNFTFTLNSGSFNSADYTGNLNVVIPIGSTSFSTNILLLDDTVDDGDELAKINIGTLPSGYIRLNDNIEIRVVDNDFTTSPWGTPVNPTYGIVASTAPAGYYESLEGKSGAVLKQAIQDIIANPAVVHAHSYGDVEFMLKEADVNPLNSNEVWLMYVEQGRAKYKYQTTASNVGSWNREHIYPQSRGGFQDGTSSTPDGINIWLPTNADDIASGHGDAHHIRAEDGPENTRRSNKDYGLNDYTGPLAGTLGSWHGDVSRALFYMACRYSVLSLANGNLPDTTLHQMGDLATLLTWNQTDPADDFEMHHNNVIYNWQINRNPFVDYPLLADYIWGTHTGEPWFVALATQTFSDSSVLLYPNPAQDYFVVSGIKGDATVEVYNLSGAKLISKSFTDIARVQVDLAAGMYLVKITSGNKLTVKKLIVK